MFHWQQSFLLTGSQQLNEKMDMTIGRLDFPYCRQFTPLLQFWSTLDLRHVTYRCMAGTIMEVDIDLIKHKTFEVKILSPGPLPRNVTYHIEGQVFAVNIFQDAVFIFSLYFIFYYFNQITAISSEPQCLHFAFNEISYSELDWPRMGPICKQTPRAHAEASVNLNVE